jgi:hypothetical protein
MRMLRIGRRQWLPGGRLARRSRGPLLGGILALADRLRDGEPLGIPGLAMTARLVNDRSSPLFRAGVGGSLPATVAEALAALESGQRTAASR